MTNQNAVERALKRILSVNWTKDLSHAESNRVLTLEFLRRSALWSQALDCTDSWPLFDIPLQIDPTIRANEDTIEKAKEHLANYKLSIGNWIHMACVMSLHWAALIDHIDISSYELPEPYEPMLVAYERGGSITRENFFIESAHVSGLYLGKREDYIRDTPFTELDEQSLDKLDEKTKS